MTHRYLKNLFFKKGYKYLLSQEHLFKTCIFEISECKKIHQTQEGSQEGSLTVQNVDWVILNFNNLFFSLLFGITVFCVFLLSLVQIQTRGYVCFVGNVRLSHSFVNVLLPSIRLLPTCTHLGLTHLPNLNSWFFSPFELPLEQIIKFHLKLTFCDPQCSYF